MPVGAVAPITGKMRKRLILDLSVALGGGTACGYAFWYGYHLPSTQRRDDFYAKLQASQQANKE
ncbi:cytochrome-c oxidase, subunit VIIa [Jaminaea rosea]|uniref:Cytochrome c oxidase subunit 9, mitochondrial n=1 Tax=Jaminaea rosea TaxID=1569628 RepID=A0A316UP56_9BASI|nr:cytochrome-c oxidase, subunit VIIa [Jaminaea rosea]PWN26744.1 cytochrome-c oxidase, subunit VIIa [Jaminaea rosea]